MSKTSIFLLLLLLHLLKLLVCKQREHTSTGGGGVVNSFKVVGFCLFLPTLLGRRGKKGKSNGKSKRFGCGRRLLIFFSSFSSECEVVRFLLR